MAIITRGDLFPAVHGAAVKIVQTARWLSILSNNPSFIVTDDRDHYWVVEKGEFSQRKYPLRSRAAQEWFPVRFSERCARHLCRKIGYPEEEFFLYTPQFDLAWWLRVVAVGLLEDIDVFQAEFPGYGVPAALAAHFVNMHRTLKGGVLARSVIVQHNVEWDRLAEFGQQVDGVRRQEIQALKLVDDIIAVSVEDKERMSDAGVAADKITIVPHGVDVESFGAGGEEIRTKYGLTTEPVLFFHGTLHYWPNTEAVRFMVTQLLPELLKTFPELKLMIVGMNPPLYYSHPSVIFTGAVNDLAAHIDAADLCLCPIFAGGGTRLKLLEYCAASKRVVSTIKGAEGIPSVSSIVRINEADSDFFQQFTASVVSEINRLNDPADASGREFAFRMSWKRVLERYLDLYRGHGRGEDHIEDMLKSKQLTLSPNRIPSKPLTMLLLLNEGCNLRCTFCDLWENFINMDVDKLDPILCSAQAIGTKVLVLTGGEPMLHPQWDEVVQRADSLGMSVNMTTNGTLVEKQWTRVMKSRLTSISVSLDGLEKTHDDLRKQKGAWKKTVAALKRLKEETAFDLSVYFVATNKNVFELIELYEFVRTMGVRFDFWPVNDAPDLYMKTKKEQAAWKAAVEWISQRERGVAQRLPFYRSALSYHNGELESLSLRCLGFVDQYGVKHDGSFLPCCVWGAELLSAANLFEKSLEEVWTGHMLEQRRSDLLNKGCSVGCYNHSLYEFEESAKLSFIVRPPSS